MLNDSQRLALFIFVCLLVRSIPVYLISTTRISTKNASMLYLCMGFIFAYNYLHAKNKKGFFGGRVWWADMRLFHAVCYFTFACNSSAHSILYIELAVSLFAVLLNYC